MRRLHPSRRRAAGALLAAVAGILAGCGSSHHAAPPTTTASRQEAPAAGLRGMIPQPLPEKPAFRLTDTAGRPYSFVPSTRGKLTYLFFGYTHCPDVCPATMSYLASALHSQPAAVRRDIDVVFVTVDPKRDSGPLIRRWLDHYNRSFVGLTGSVADIAAVERAAGVPVAPPSKKPASASYTLAHSSFLLAYSPDDRAHVVYAAGYKPADYVHDMPLLLKFR